MDYGNQNYITTLEWVMQWAFRGGVAAAFIGAIMVGMSYFSDEANARMNGLKVLIIGCCLMACKVVFEILVWLGDNVGFR